MLNCHDEMTDIMLSNVDITESSLPQYFTRLELIQKISMFLFIQYFMAFGLLPAMMDRCECFNDILFIFDILVDIEGGGFYILVVVVIKTLWL